MISYVGDSGRSLKLQLDGGLVVCWRFDRVGMRMKIEILNREAGELGRSQTSSVEIVGSN